MGAPSRASAGAAARALPPALDPGDAQRPHYVSLPEPDPDGRVLRDPAVPAGRPGLRRVPDGRTDAAGLGHAVRHRLDRLAPGRTLPGAHDRPRRSGAAASGLPAAARDDQARNRDGPVRDRDGRTRHRHGPDRLPARQRRAVGGRRRGPQRGRRPAVHRPAARRLARHRADRSDRDQRPDRRLLRQSRERSARLRRGQAAGRDQARGQRQLRLDRPGPRRRAGGGPRRAEHRSDRRQLRRRAAAGAEDGAAGRGAARLRGVLRDSRPAESRSRRQGRRRPSPPENVWATARRAAQANPRTQTVSGDRAQTSEGRAAQLAHERVDDALLVLLEPVGDGADHGALALEQRRDRLVDRPRGEQV